MEPQSHLFKQKAKEALDDANLARALKNMHAGFQVKRLKATEKLPEFQDLRERGREIKNHALENLDFYLARFEERVTEQGGQVHWARTAAEARDAVLKICQSVDAKTVTKGKSMIAEEIALNDHLSNAGIEPIETDLGEYIIQLRHELPSHIIAPAIHLNKDQVEETFRENHTQLDPNRRLEQVQDFTDEARTILRQKFQSADVGITGANFMIAETGSTVIVTNEGNGDLTQTLPKVHIVVASIEKTIPTLEDAATILRLLARSATGQEYSSYTTYSTGPRRPGDQDGPEQFHVVILDNGRSALLGTEAQDVLRCIRCGACMNHCPVYGAVGGHAYGWVVPGPIGSALDPGLIGLDEAHDLPNASTFCGKCAEVCPMKIPLPKIMHHWRVREFEKKLSPPRFRQGLALWGWFAKRPAFYRAGTAMAMGVLGRLGAKRGRFAKLPLAGGWTKFRDMPAPEGGTFQKQWAKHVRTRGGSRT
ncbi:MAG: LutB/LldF family L-lactate oxidation iron-sulfur protein [Pseudomonadota bacterium]